MILLGGQLFKTKKAAQEWVRQQVHSFDPNNSLWLELLHRHPESETKIGVGVKSFRIAVHSMSRQPYLVVIRSDGSEVDFSWRSCIDGVGKSAEANLRAAMRDAVKNQVCEFQSTSGKECMLCGASATHVDHIVTFETLVQNFLVTRSDIPTVFEDCAETNRAKFKKEDQAFQTAWSAFHQSIPNNLRMLCARCNLTRPK